MCIRDSVVTGPNGGGKSTIAKLMMGLYHATEGKIFLDGEDITKCTIYDRAKAGIGFAFQQPPRFKGMTIRRLLSLAAGTELPKHICCGLLSRVGLCAEEYLDREVDATLSGGEMKRIEIATVLVKKHKPVSYTHLDVYKRQVLDAVANVIQLEQDMEIYTSGATNIFRYPELSDKQSAQEIISAFEEKQQLSELVTQTLSSDSKGIQVYIGNETPVQNMKDCSVVTATYELGEGMQGTIGIIGPKRMDYERVMDTLKTLQTELDTIFHKKE